MLLRVRIAAAASALMLARALAPSVTLTASARPRSGNAYLSNACGSVETGGVISAVTAKRPARSASEKCPGSASLKL